MFGLIVSMSTFSTEDEAAGVASGVEYGWEGVSGRAPSPRVADALRIGMLWINCYKRVDPGSPLGGVGLSGYGREMGFEAMHEYEEVKSVCLKVSGGQPAWYGGA